MLAAVASGLEQRDSVQLLYHSLWFLNVTKLPCSVMTLRDEDITPDVESSSEKSSAGTASTTSEKSVASSAGDAAKAGFLFDRILVSVLAAIDDYATENASELHVPTEAFQVR